MQHKEKKVVWSRLRDLLFNFGSHPISLKQLRLRTSNLVCWLVTRRTIQKMQNYTVFQKKHPLILLECVSSTDLSASPLRPHVWRTGIITLASCPGMYWVQNRGPGLQGFEWTGTTLSRSAHPRRRSARSARSAFRQLEPSPHSTCQAVHGRHPSVLRWRTSHVE